MQKVILVHGPAHGPGGREREARSGGLTPEEGADGSHYSVVGVETASITGHGPPCCRKHAVLSDGGPWWSR